MPTIIKPKEVHTLHRYFIWSDRMREHYKSTLGTGKIDVASENGISTLLYMSYWYASLYVVIEGWKELKSHDQPIDRLLENKQYVDLLKRYRNGIFHFQKKYFDERLMNFIKEGEKTAIWAKSLHNEFSRYFLNYFKSV